MIPVTTNSVPEWIRNAATQVNPMLSGYPFNTLSSTPTSINAGFTYYDSALNTQRTWNGTVWLTPVSQIATASAWTAATGTASRATFATYTAPTAGVLYSQTFAQAAFDHIQVLSQHLKALIDDLKSSKVI